MAMGIREFKAEELQPLHMSREDRDRLESAWIAVERDLREQTKGSYRNRLIESTHRGCIVSALNTLTHFDNWVLGRTVPVVGGVGVLCCESFSLSLLRKLSTEGDWGLSAFSMAISMSGLFLTVLSLIHVLESNKSVEAVKNTDIWKSLIQVQLAAMYLWFGTAIAALGAWFSSSVIAMGLLLTAGLLALTFSLRALIWYTALVLRVGDSGEMHL